MKKKTLVPLIIFLLGICLVGFIVYKTDTHEKNERHITAQLNATTYGERIKNEIASGIEITDALKQILISENGEIYLGRSLERVNTRFSSRFCFTVHFAISNTLRDAQKDKPSCDKHKK